MTFRLPTFNLDCFVWHAPVFPVIVAPSFGVKGNLAWGRRVHLPETSIDTSGWFIIMTLLLPPGTDLRCNINSAFNPDMIEVPAGSGRFYRLADFDDIGKGFPNEHRCALIIQTAENGRWPVPTS